jgi:hypothetical protein
MFTVTVWGPEPHTPAPPPLQTVYVNTVYQGILIHTGRGGGGDETERRLEGQQLTKLGQNYQHDWLYLESINSDKHLLQSPFTGQYRCIQLISS